MCNVEHVVVVVVVVVCGGVCACVWRRMTLKLCSVMYSVTSEFMSLLY
jgi:hypothetical protein